MAAPPQSFAPGQRWVSQTQPEFGLALILSADFSHVKVHFPAAGETLTYATRSAPLRRVAFEPGDTVRNQVGEEFHVVAVREDEGRLIYVDAGENELPESELSDTLSVQKPEARILAGHIDDPWLWRLRQQALQNRHMARAHGARGLAGGRISLIPHQLYIANEVAGRFLPRVLLADEVGLGKTIEACLILHRLRINGRAQRILILVPDALVNQWFVELYRRFSLTFAIFDEDRAVAIEGQSGEEEAGDQVNPFFDDQLVLCSTSWIANNPRRAEQVAAGKWDLAIVDEAHHLEWTPEESSPGYDAVAAIAKKTPGLLLLTATPEQLGREGHFARLRLLDPDRFSDLEAFITESEHYEEVSRLADRLRSREELREKDEALLVEKLGEEALASLKANDTLQNRAEITAELVDLHGTGRVMFRNRRNVLKGFPERRAHLWPLMAESSDSDGFAEKVDWLANLLTDLPDEKFLLIGHSRELAEKIETALLERISATAALFHEDLTLLQRDRNAAWFAEPAEEGGARLLICSEIGSEGRNFQFAHHLVLFDLPDDPALLEQRIGRLDRIGQTADIHIHVPHLPGSPEELWARWYHEGVGAFEHTLHGSAAIYREFHDEVTALAESADWESELPELLERTRIFKEKVEKELEEGRDHLLEMSSFDPIVGEELVEQVEDLDMDWKLEKYMLRVFDHFGVTVEELREREYLLKPEHLFSSEVFIGLPEEGMSITFDRDTALAREELGFFTWDHPMVTSATHMLLASERGNAAFVKVEGARKQALLLEVVCVLECIAPEKLHAERFLPPQPIQVLVDHDGNDQTDSPEAALLGKGKATPGPDSWLREKAAPLRAMVPKILAAAEDIAEEKATALRKSAVNQMTERISVEISRLKKLRQLGHPVPNSEIRTATRERDALTKHLSEARLRVDSVRLVLAGVGGGGRGGRPK